MMSRAPLLILLLPLLATTAGPLVAKEKPVELKVGDKAPGFTLPASTGGQISLSDFAGKSTVVVGFFPAAFTGG